MLTYEQLFVASNKASELISYCQENGLDYEEFLAIKIRNQINFRIANLERAKTND